MSIKTSMMVFGLLLLTPLAFGSEQAIQYVPEFVGGLNISQITACEKQYEKACPIVNAQTAMQGVAQQGSCIVRKMSKDRSCLQASKIRQLTSYPATDIKQYGRIAVFDITTLADGIDTYYMVDTQGKFIRLNTALDLSADKNYLRLKEKYPDIALTGFLYWSQINENLFPEVHLLPNKNQQLIFRQALRDGECVGCATIGIADIAYEFDQHGAYLGSKLIKIEQRDKALPSLPSPSKPMVSRPLPQGER